MIKPLQWIAKQFKADALRPVPSSAGTAGLSGIYDLPDYRERATDFASLSRQGYQGNALVFACIGLYTRRMPEASLVAFEGDKPVDPSRPLMQLLRKDYHWRAMQTATFMAIGGQAYWMKIRNPVTDLPEDYKVLHVGHIKPTSWRTPDGTVVEGYLYDPKGQAQFSRPGHTRVVHPDDIIPLRWPSPDTRNPRLALAPLQVVAMQVQTEEIALRYIYRVLKNDATPKTVFMLPADAVITDAQAARLRTEIDSRFSADNVGRPALMQGGMDVKRLSLGLNELDLSALGPKMETAICQAFDVHPLLAKSLTGLQNQNTRAATGSLLKDFILSSLVPLWTTSAGAITEGLSKDFGGSIVVSYDTDKVAAIKDMAEIQQRANEARSDIRDSYAAGLLTHDEARTLLGYEL